MEVEHNGGQAIGQSACDPRHIRSATPGCTTVLPYGMFLGCHRGHPRHRWRPAVAYLPLPRTLVMLRPRDIPRMSLHLACHPQTNFVRFVVNKGSSLVYIPRATEQASLVQHHLLPDVAYHVGLLCIERERPCLRLREGPSGDCSHLRRGHRRRGSLSRPCVAGQATHGRARFRRGHWFHALRVRAFLLTTAHLLLANTHVFSYDQGVMSALLTANQVLRS